MLGLVRLPSEDLVQSFDLLGHQSKLVLVFGDLSS